MYIFNSVVYMRVLPKIQYYCSYGNDSLFYRWLLLSSWFKTCSLQTIWDGSTSDTERSSLIPASVTCCQSGTCICYCFCRNGPKTRSWLQSVYALPFTQQYHRQCLKVLRANHVTFNQSDRLKSMHASRITHSPTTRALSIATSTIFDSILAYYIA